MEDRGHLLTMALGHFVPFVENFFLSLAIKTKIGANTVTHAT